MAEIMDIKRILIPLDGSELAEQAIPAAAALAGGSAQILLFHVVEDSVREREHAMQELRAIGERWTAVLPGSPRCETGAGDPAAAIIEAARQLSCDLIVAASHGRGAVGRLAFGSVADAFVRTSTVPVLIVRANQDAMLKRAVPSFGRVVVPYDGSDLAAGAFPVATALAKRLDAGILLVYAIVPSTFPPPVAPMQPYYPAMVYDEAIEEAQAEATAALERAVAGIAESGVPVRQAVVKGPPFDVIVEVAQSDDLVVMTSHGRSGLERWLLGSVAEKLVREGPVPVVIVPATGRAEQARSA